MEKLINSDPSIRQDVNDLVFHLRQSIKKLYRIRIATKKTAVLLINHDEVNFKIWLVAICFITRKILTLYFGETDLDFGIKDFEITFIKRN